MGVKTFNVMALGKSNLADPESVSYQDSIDIIYDELQKTRKQFIKIGWYLMHIRNAPELKEDGYANIYELAYDKFRISQPTAVRFMKICKKFSINHNSPELDPKYEDFSVSQLFEMLPMQQEQIEQVIPDMTVSEIRELKKENRKKAVGAVFAENTASDDNIPGQTSIEDDFSEYLPDESDNQEIQKNEAQDPLENHGQVIDGEYREVTEENPPAEDVATSQSVEQEPLSALGYPKSEYPEGSLIAGEGCGHKYDCFSCAQICEIRGKNRYCVEAPMGNPFPCTTMQIIGDSEKVFPDGCQFINQELAFHRQGDNQPVPCCKECKELCIFRCERAAKETVEESKLPVLKDDLAVTRYILDEERDKLDKFMEAGGIPEMTLIRQKTIVAALASMVYELEAATSDADPAEEEVQVQPEFPVLKNNDQRKEWLANYKAWSFWYRDENIDVNYYKYDFPDGSRLVVTEYPQRLQYYSGKLENEVFYHLLEKDKKAYKKTYDEAYRHTSDNETHLIEFLKNLQKKGIKE